MSGSITGHVTDTNGNAVQDVEVTAIDTDTGTEVATVRTNSSGDYSVSVPDDTYDVRAEKRGYLTDTVTGVTVSGGTATAPDHDLVGATYKTRGENSEFGYGILGKATGTSGEPVGVRGIAPNASDGFGLSTPGDARVDGDLEATSGHTLTAGGATVFRTGLPGADGFGSTGSGNVVGGSSQNTAAGTVGSTIAGGGDNSTAGHQVTDNYGTVGGGIANQAGDNQSGVTSAIVATVAGGSSNVAGHAYATVAGGGQNTATGAYSTIGGGDTNNASGKLTAILGGRKNEAADQYASVGGGWRNDSKGYAATVAGGNQNQAVGDEATVAGGSFNAATKTNATVAGGSSNDAKAKYSAIGGGLTNVVEANAQAATVGGGEDNTVATSGTDYATISGGSSNYVTGVYSTIGGGGLNRATDKTSTIAGGGNNVASGQNTFVGGGGSNAATDAYSTVGGGKENKARGSYAFVGGGRKNDALGDLDSLGGGEYNQTGRSGTISNIYATVAGGYQNKVWREGGSVAGGRSNQAFGGFDSIGGGDTNETGTSGTASDLYATIPGGRDNRATASYSFAAGRKARATDVGAFVWSDSTDSTFSSSVADQFLIDASGGVGLRTNSTPHYGLSIEGSNATAGGWGDHLVGFESTSTGGDVLALRNSAEAQPDADTNFITFFADKTGESVGAVQGDGSGGVNYKSGNFDLAEYFPKADPGVEFEAGDVVGLRGGEVVEDPLDGEAALVVSGSPMVTGNVPDDDEAEAFVCLALTGQVPVQVDEPVDAGEVLVAGGEGRAVPAGSSPLVDPPVVGLALSGSEAGEVLTLVGGHGFDAASAGSTADQPEAASRSESSADGQQREIEKLRAELDRKDDRIETLEAENESLSERLASVESQLGIGPSGSATPADD